MNEIKSNSVSKVYRREKMQNLKPTTSGSMKYCRSKAIDIFDRFENINIVECVVSGNKTDSQFVKRGEKSSPSGVVVFIASSGGKWGKSRRDYYPA